MADGGLAHSSVKVSWRGRICRHGDAGFDPRRIGLELLMQSGEVRIVPYCLVAPSEEIARDLDDIFFEASATTSFASAAARVAFRHRWLGRYLECHPHEAFLALEQIASPAADRTGQVAGYLVGAMTDPARDPELADLAYISDFASLSRAFPAHLHINLAPRFRSAGIGARLIDAFAAHARARGAAGMHVVTAKGMRNVGFYLGNGFKQLGEADWKGRQLVLLGRVLAAH